MNVSTYKVVVLGDSGVGKTSVISRCHNKPTLEMLPKVYDNFTTLVTRENVAMNLQMWDTSGLSEFDGIRSEYFTNTNVFVICFSLLDIQSFERVKTKWQKDICAYNPNAIIVLVGTKSELRDEVSGYDKYWTYWKKRDNKVTHDMGEKLARQINAVAYVEVSAKSNAGIDTFLTKIVEAVTQQRRSLRVQLLRMSVGKIEAMVGSAAERIEDIYAVGRKKLLRSMTE